MTPLRYRSDRAAAFAIGLLLVIGLAGCASKNPLIDEPSGQAGRGKQPMTASKASSSNASDATADAGVQTTKQRRLFGILSPYRIDIQQGNFVSREMLAQLKEGMTREQVRFALGTPLLTDIFHADRWDYPFRLQKNNGEVISSRVSVYFENNVLTRYDGGNLPSEVDYLYRLSGKPPKTDIGPQVPKAPSSALPEESRQLPPTR